MPFFTFTETDRQTEGEGEGEKERKESNTGFLSDDFLPIKRIFKR
jgi:hypothetical protein